MSMTAAEDEVFTAFLRDKAAEAYQAVKYKPNDFLKMLGSIGGYRTAVSLLSKGALSEGFKRLWSEGRLDLSVEAVIVESQWAKFFDQQLLSLAEDRLIKAGYKVIGQDLGVGVCSVSESALEVGSLKLLFSVGQKYSRSDIFTVLGFDPHPSGGDWFTGYVQHAGNYFVFCNVGSVGRTGHDYDNHFIGDQLVWYGKNGSKLEHPSIKRLLSRQGQVFIFYRSDNQDPFIFAGVAMPSDVVNSTPVKVVWGFSSNVSRNDGQVVGCATVVEGAVSTRLVKMYERDRGARLRCVNYWGWRCFVCSFDFERIYGGLGKDFIHVHHLKPLSEIGGEYHLDPEQDLRPVCPNCHAMLHRSVPALTIEELQRQMHLASL